MTIQEILILAGVSVGLPIIATCVLLCAAGALDSWAEGPKQEEQKPPQTTDALREILDRHVAREAQRLYASCFTEVAREFDPRDTYTQDEWIAYAHEVATAAVSFQFNQKEEEKHERHPE